MKRIILLALTTVTFMFFCYWLHLVVFSSANEFRETYASFGIKIPEITYLFLQSLRFWKVTIFIIGIFSYAPILLFKGKLQYLSFIIPIFF